MELAFLAPALILLIFFTIQGSLYFYGRNVAIQSAREGVSTLRLARNPSDIAASVQYTEQFAGSLSSEGLIGAQATPTYDNDSGEVSMTVTGRVIQLVPSPIVPKLVVTARAEGRAERFKGPGVE